jgi:hypothetical protein
MTTVEALAQYRTIAERVFGTGNRKWGHADLFKASTLEEEIKTLVKARCGDQDARISSDDSSVSKGAA